MRLPLRPVAAIAASALVGASVALAAPASASGWPSAPVNVHITAITPTSFTVTANRATNATAYRVYSSPVESDVYYANLTKRIPRRHITTSSTPTVVPHWTYTTGTIYYRYATVNGANIRVDIIRSMNLQPATPTGVTVNATAQGTWLTWNFADTLGAVVTVAENSSFTLNRHDFHIRNRTAQYSPPNLVKDKRYYFTVRNENGTTLSGYSTHLTAVTLTALQPLRLMSYNILNLGADGNPEGGTTIAPWAERRGPAAALIESANPDVIGVQEGNFWVDEPNHILQIDSLNSALGSTYTLAHTELRFGDPGYIGFRAGGNYILYRTSAYRAIGDGGHWDIGDQRWAVYQELESIATGARLLVVNTHLVDQMGSIYDAQRQRETQAMIDDGRTLASQLGVPAVYTGDFNSDTNVRQFALDGPAVQMRAARIADTRATSTYTVNPGWDSANDYLRTPPRYSLYIDYVMAAAGIAGARVGMCLHMSGGQFVGVIPSDHNPVYTDIQVPYTG